MKEIDDDEDDLEFENDDQFKKVILSKHGNKKNR